MYFLILESSTTSAKAMLYNTEDNTHQVETKEYEDKYQVEPGVYDPVHIFDSTMEVGRRVTYENKVDAIALCGTWHSIMLCDDNMVPQTSLYNWNYTGASAICADMRKDDDYTRAYHKKTGGMVNATYPFFKLKYLAQQDYNLKDYKAVSQGEYTTYRLTNEKVVTDVMAAGTGLLNTHTRQYDSEILADLGITEQNLGKVVGYNRAYTLTEEGAKLLGISAGIPVLPAMPDGSLNQVGSGALKEGVMTFSVGTSGAMRMVTNAPAVGENIGTWCYVAPNQKWLAGAATAGCCNCVDWYIKSVYGESKAYSEAERGFVSKENLPVFLPFLFGERCPGWRDDRRGGFYELNPTHDRYDMYHAVQEGVLFNLYHCYEALTKIAGTPHTIKLSGGILSSRKWMQMAADIFGATMEVDVVSNASTMGGVAILLEHMGLIDSIEDFSLPTGEIITPSEFRANDYKERYKKYLYWYERSV